MSDPKTETGAVQTSEGLNSQVKGMRYSLKEMMAEVRLERKHSALGRELLDSTEIDKMFTDRRRKKRKQG